jgi:hypothetical protein
MGGFPAFEIVFDGAFGGPAPEGRLVSSNVHQKED